MSKVVISKFSNRNYIYPDCVKYISSKDEVLKDDAYEFLYQIAGDDTIYEFDGDSINAVSVD